MRKKYSVIALFILALTVVSSVFVSMWQLPLSELTLYVGEHRLLGTILFSLIMFIATVLAPISALPAVPLIAPILGPFTTAIACIVGWTLGAIVAFSIARFGGRPLVLRFFSTESLERYELRIPKETHFLLLVMLRMVAPVDILSYALGLVSTVSFREYVLTTLIGILWFSFAFAYLGEALFSQNYVLLGVLSVASVIILLSAYTYVKKYGRHTDTHTK